MDSFQVWKADTLVASIAFLLSVSLLAQGNLGRIIGSVTDQSGGLMGGTVTVTDVQRGISRTLTIDLPSSDWVGTGQFSCA